ncbi:MAG: Dual-specificity kinase, spindle pole body (SPB) duplication and spindle checkpoint function [Thelocarpon impressellum]|nr:MAG: Dual-specificity kinase, spindle pole body (SPB) duplication and spindle checkpoint function [Thelocarpon impressellum]
MTTFPTSTSLSRPTSVMSRTVPAVARPLSAAGSSDDDDESFSMIPMKFSALTNALLRNEAEVGEPSSPPPVARAPSYLRGTRSSRSKERKPFVSPVSSTPRNRTPSRTPTGDRKETKPPSLSPTTSGPRKETVPPQRVVRVSPGAAGSAPTPRIRTPEAQKTALKAPIPHRVVRLGTPGSGNGSPAPPSSRARARSNPVEPVSAQRQPASGAPSPQELITPAPRPRSVMVKRSSGSPPAPSKGSGGRIPASPGLAKEGDKVPARPDSAGRTHTHSGHGSNNAARARPGEDAPVQGSMRVKRVGKVTGTFLRGPARRGRRRQSEDDQSPKPAAVPEPKSPEQLRESGSRAALGHRQSPPQSRSPAKGSKPRFKAGGPAPSLAPSRNQENEPPPTFKKATRPSALSLLNRDDDAAEKGSVATTTSASSNAPLAPRINNAVHRAPPPPPKMSLLHAATSTARTDTTASKKKRIYMAVNGKLFTRLDCIGRGGSCRVYRVMAENSSLFALKKVGLENLPASIIQGYKGEIDLLQKLRSEERVVTLYDYELNEEKQTLSVLLEIGESDLNRLLERALNAGDSTFDICLVRHYWKEMLECLWAVHQHNIVHSDLKPANFLLVKGRLKLIDFGIANAISDDTVNVAKDLAVGTPNYMSPETMLDVNAHRGQPSAAGKMIKVGKPSDVWSLGCILYQMVYGQPPFAHISSTPQRIMAITSASYAIEFPRQGLGGAPVPAGLIITMKKCLRREQHSRPMVAHLLSPRDLFLYPESPDSGVVQVREHMLEAMLANVVKYCELEGLPSESEFNTWPSMFFKRIQALEKERVEREVEAAGDALL